MASAEPAVTATSTSWFTAFKLIFETGNHIDNLRGPVKQDGFVASMCTCILLLALGSSVTIAVHINMDEVYTLEQPHEQLGMICFVIVACSVMIRMIHQRDQLGTYESKERNGLGNLASDEKGHSKIENLEASGSGNVMEHMRQGIRDKLPLIGVGLFFLVGIYLDVITIFGHFRCLEFYRSFCDLYTLFWQTTDCFFKISRLVYMPVAITFVLQFDGMSFFCCVKNYYSLMTITVCTLVLWFYTLLRDFDGHEGRSELNCSITNRTDDMQYDILQCLKQTSGLYEISSKYKPYFHPLIIEFSLLVGEQLAHLIFHVNDKKQKDDRGNQDVRNHPASNLCSLELSPRNRSRTESNNTFVILTTSETTLLLENPVINQRLNSPHVAEPTHNLQIIYSQSRQIESSQVHSYRGVVPISILLGILFNLLFLVIAMLSFFKDFINTYNFTVLHNIFMATFYSVQLVCLIQAFSKTVTFPSNLINKDKQNNHKGLQYLVVVSTLGSYIHLFLKLFGLVAFLTNNSKVKELPVWYNCLSVLAIILNIMYNYVQTSFIVHATQVQCPKPITDEPDALGVDTEQGANTTRLRTADLDPDTDTTGSTNADLLQDTNTVGSTSADLHNNSNTIGSTIADVHQDSNTFRSTSPDLHQDSNTIDSTTADLHQDSNNTGSTSADLYQNSNTTGYTGANLHQGTNTTGFTSSNLHQCTNATRKTSVDLQQDTMTTGLTRAFYQQGANTTGPTDIQEAKITATSAKVQQGENIIGPTSADSQCKINPSVSQIECNGHTSDSSISQHESATAVSTVPRISKKHHSQYRKLLFYLAFSNAIMWIIDSLIDVNNINRTDPWQENFYRKDTWEATVNTIMPFILFFRFTSCLMLFGVYFEVRQ